VWVLWRDPSPVADCAADILGVYATLPGAQAAAQQHAQDQQPPCTLGEWGLDADIAEAWDAAPNPTRTGSEWAAHTMIGSHGETGWDYVATAFRVMR
jgi:hypothetical protein